MRSKSASVSSGMPAPGPWLIAGALVSFLLAGCGGAGATEPPSAEEIAAATSEASAKTAVASARSTAASFATDDGVTLAGTLYGSGKTVALLAHMRPADQTSWQPFAQKVAAAGYAALTLDFRGYGSSEGERQYNLIDHDVRAAIAYLRNSGFQSIVLIGASMGGTACAKNSRESNVTGLAMLSSPHAFEGITVGQTDLAGPAYPKLFIVAQDDEPVATDIRTLHSFASSPKNIKLFTGNEHGTNLFNGEHGPELEQLLLDFIKKAAAG